MEQGKFSIAEPQAEFLDRHRSYGFKDKSSMVREALDRLKRELEREDLIQSADLYAEVYDKDPDLPRITEGAIEGWPE